MDEGKVYSNLKDYQQRDITKFKKAFKDMVATSQAAYDRNAGRTKKVRNRMYDRDEIQRIVEGGDSIEKANLSAFFFETSGLYKRIILHYATFLTYAWILVPYTKNRNKKNSIKERKVAAAYYNAADFCTTFQIDTKSTLFAKEVLVKGAYYGLLYDTGNKMVIMNLPFDYCRSRFKNSEDIDIVEFDMSFFDTIRDQVTRDNILSTYPSVVQLGYRRYKATGKDKWIFLPAEMGIYFSFFEERPFFLDLIPIIDDLSDYMVLDKKRNLQALKKILAQKVPIDGMKLVFEPDEAEEMHNGSVDMLPNNEEVDVLTTYCDVELLDLSCSDDEKTSIEEIQNIIYSSAGLSKELFFATTEAGLEYSINNDLAMMMILGHKFAHFFTTIINYKYENAKVKFKLLILPISYYNSADYTSRAKELASFGYSFLTPILSTGIDQTNLAALKDLENELLELDETLKPLQSSYTQSGKVGQTPNNSVTANDQKASQGGTTQESTSKETTSKESTSKETTSKESTSKKTTNKSNSSTSNVKSKSKEN